LWIHHYGDECAPLIEGVGETLLTLRSKGYELAVVSSGSRVRVFREIDQSVLRDAFSVIMCKDDVIEKKPHPEGLLLAMERMNAQPRHCAYVGDAPEDIEMGRRGNVITIGVRSAYPSSGRVASAKPDLYLERMAEIMNYF
jgi:HAD superfamily hydrolase (TIGR01509 family)